MDLDDSTENCFLSQIDLSSIDLLNDSSENLFLSQIDESVLINDAFLNASFDLGLDIEKFIESCDKPDLEISEENKDIGASSDKVADVHTVQEMSTASVRFGGPVSDEEIQHLKDSMRNKNTDKNTKWAIKIFDEWRQQRKDGIIPEVHTMDKPTIAYWLTRFVMEVRKKSGEEYPPKSLYLILCGILRNLRDKKVHDKNFLDGKDPDFAELVAVIDSRMKTLLAKGHGANIKQADPISLDEEDKLWEMGVFGSGDSQSLQHTVFFYSCKLFGLRGRDEHRNLTCEQFQIGEDRNGEYIRFTGRETKTFKGGLAQMSLANKDIKHYCTKGPRCLATFFQQYISILGNSGNFYRRPIPGPRSTLKYSKQPVGINKLANFMKDICQKGCLKGNFTNHSGKRTCATSLYNSGIDEQDIMDRTGHRSTSAVRQYKRCSDDMRKTVSSVLDPNPPKRLKVCENYNQQSQITPLSDATTPCPKTETNGSEEKEHCNSIARNPLADITSSSGIVNFSGCTFNFANSK